MLNWFKSLFGTNEKSYKQESTAFTIRQGKSVPVDDAFRAWTSGDLNIMLRAVSTRTNSIDRHFLLQSIVGATYKLRKEDKYRQLCIEYAEKHLHEFPAIAPVLKDDMDGVLPRVTTFQNYATVLTEDGNYDKAISICEEALKYGLHDNTQSGFKGRIARIKKKAEKENA
ncbi:MAG: hypothetical protein KAR01_08545 [Desulfocapsa sp.]|nr:hypothetical protein [Desulfocapsa sp.]